MKTICALKEWSPTENRVSMTPGIAMELKKSFDVKLVLESNAGHMAGFSDDEYKQAQAEILPSAGQCIDNSDIVLCLDAKALASQKVEKKIILGLMDPYFNPDLMQKFCEQKATVLALELVPRTSRAQSADVLSSQANLAGYVSVLKATEKMPKIMPLFMTAAGTIKPARVLVLGAGVAGLQAIATAKRLGALVFAYDVRKEVKEQIESLGGKFVEIELEESAEGGGGYAKALQKDSAAKQREALTEYAKDFDLIITTAQIPGKKAPILLNEEIFSLLKPGAVLVDMAAKTGGNIPKVKAGEWQKINDIWLYGADNLASQVPKDASFCFGKNIKAYLELFIKEGFSLSDEIIRESCLCHEGEWINPKFKEFILKKASE